MGPRESAESKAFIHWQQALVDRRLDGPRIAIKDNFDWAGTVTTLGSRYIAETRDAATDDAACLSELRRSGAKVVGKTNLHELAFGTTGVNCSYGTPVNPLAEDRIPGGSSSGAAVALARNLCDIAFGTDTGGSVRIPPACCGVLGLKTTYGKLPMRGIWPLAKSLDVIGPMARNTSDLEAGMRLLEPELSKVEVSRPRVGRVPVKALDPIIDRSIDQALSELDAHVSEADLTSEQWEGALAATNDLLWAEAAESNMPLKPVWGKLSSSDNLEAAVEILNDRQRRSDALKVRAEWRTHLRSLFETFDFLALPTLEAEPPLLDDAPKRTVRLARFTGPVNLSGLPAVVLPIRSDRPVPISMQFIGPDNSEAHLIGMARLVERSQVGSPGGT